MGKNIKRIRYRQVMHDPVTREAYLRKLEDARPHMTAKQLKGYEKKIINTLVKRVKKKKTKKQLIKSEQRNSERYWKWRARVLTRDKHTCRVCKARPEKLEAHHIKEWQHYPELRFQVDNGLTLCIPCHTNKHPWRAKLLKYIDHESSVYNRNMSKVVLRKKGL